MAVTQVPVLIDPIEESGYPGTTQTIHLGPYAFNGKLFGVFIPAAPVFDITVWSSSDNGLTWQQQDAANSPAVSIGVNMNTSFNPTTGIITIGYKPAGVNTIIRWITFNCTTNLFTAGVYPDLTDVDSSTVELDFVIRTDSTVVAFYKQSGTGHVIYRINTAGVWGVANSATPETGGHSYAEAGAILDSIGTTHLIYGDKIGAGSFTWTHVPLSSLNVLGAPTAIATELQNGGDFLQAGVIWNNSVVIPLARALGGTSRASVFIGTPLSAPVWTVVDLEVTATGSVTIFQTNLLVSGSTLYFLWRFAPGGGVSAIHIASNTGSGFSVVSVYYDAIADPPNAVVNQFVQDIGAVIAPNGSLSAFATMTALSGNFPAYYLIGAAAGIGGVLTFCFKGQKIYG